jgi:hypothetical protein
MSDGEKRVSRGGLTLSFGVLGNPKKISSS